MQYPTPNEVERSLKLFAEELGDTTELPFRVDVVARYGGKPPLYTVVILCAQKEPIRHKLSQVLNGSFSLGGSFFALNVSEAQRVLEYTRGEGSTKPEATPTRS